MVTVLRSLGDRSLRSLFDVERGLVSREVYVNEEIYQMELEQIFARCWLFLGHESQIPNPGDFVVTRMGEEEVILVRASGAGLDAPFVRNAPPSIHSTAVSIQRPSSKRCRRQV